MTVKRKTKRSRRSKRSRGSRKSRGCYSRRGKKLGEFSCYVKRYSRCYKKGSSKSFIKSASKHYNQRRSVKQACSRKRKKYTRKRRTSGRSKAKRTYRRKPQAIVVPTPLIQPVQLPSLKVEQMVAPVSQPQHGKVVSQGAPEFARMVVPQQVPRFGAVRSQQAPEIARMVVPQQVPRFGAVRYQAPSLKVKQMAAPISQPQYGKVVSSAPERVLIVPSGAKIEKSELMNLKPVEILEGKKAENPASHWWVVHGDTAVFNIMIIRDKVLDNKYDDFYDQLVEYNERQKNENSLIRENKASIDLDVDDRFLIEYTSNAKSMDEFFKILRERNKGLVYNFGEMQIINNDLKRRGTDLLELSIHTRLALVKSWVSNGKQCRYYNDDTCRLASDKCEWSKKTRFCEEKRERAPVRSSNQSENELKAQRQLARAEDMDILRAEMANRRRAIKEDEGEYYYF